MATTVFTHNGVRHMREVFSSAPDQVIVVRLSVSQPGKLSFTATVDRPGNHQNDLAGSDTLLLSGVALPVDDNPGLPVKERQTGVRFLAKVRAILEGGGKVQTVPGQDGQPAQLRVTGATSVRLLIDCATDFRYPAGQQAMSAAVDRNLHAAAKVVSNELGGKFPRSIEKLRKLPGIGEYTAGAIASIAFDLPYAAMDANAERVIARYAAIEEPLPKSKPAMRAALQALVPQKRAGDFAQALMDLGSAICTPKRPACGNCPWMTDCKARKRGIQELLPVKGEERERPLKRGAAFVARDASGAVLLQKRPEKGLLGGMLQPPLGPWTEKFPTAKEALLQAPFRANWRKRAGIVRHGFTHFELEIEVYTADITKALKAGGKWIAADRLSSSALPTVMRKIVMHALDDGGPLFAQLRPARKR